MLSVRVNSTRTSIAGKHHSLLVLYLGLVVSFVFHLGLVVSFVVGLVVGLVVSLVICLVIPVITFKALASGSRAKGRD